MNQSNELKTISQNQQTQGGLKRGKRDAFDRLTNWLILFISILIVLLLKDVVLNNVQTPRTSLERDIMDYTETLKKDEKNAVAHAGLGVAYMNMGSFEPAAGEFAVAAKQDPKNPQYQYNLGVAYHKLGRDKAALKALKTAAAKGPRWEAPLFEMGKVYMDQKAYDKAIAAFDNSIKLLPGNADAHFSLGYAYELKNRQAEALSHYREALRYVPDYERAAEAINRLEGR